MNHRGPDDQTAPALHDTPDGRCVDLLHSRLSIFDLDQRGNQPFHRGSLWLTYNGELYNHVEVRRGARGARRRRSTRPATPRCSPRRWRRTARTRSTAARACGPSPPYDEVAGDLLLCRDRFGEKPLYLHRDARGPLLRLGAQVRLRAARAAAGGRPRAPARYLVNGYKSLLQDAARRSSRASRAARPAVTPADRARRRGAPGALLDAARPAATTSMTLRGRGGRHARAADPVGRAADARRRPAGVLDERRRRLAVAHLDRDGACSSTRCAASRSSTTTRATRSRTMIDHAVRRARRATTRRSRSTRATSCRACARSCVTTTRRSTRSPTSSSGC